MPFDALVLAGGRGTRMGGTHKPGLVLDGATLLARVVAACAAAERVVVVGPPTEVPAVFVAEDEPFGGPAAAVRTGLAQVSADVVVLLAADLVALGPDDVDALAARAPAVLVDDQGRAQWLVSAWPTADLCEAVATAVPGDALGPRLRDLPHQRITRPGQPWRDVDTPEDWELACRTT